MTTYVRTRWTWLKWTVQSWFLSDANALPCGHYEGTEPPRHPRGDCPFERPGDDDQFGKWLKKPTTVMCVRCRDYFDAEDPDDDDIRQLPTGEWVCGMCRKGREDA